MRGQILKFSIEMAGHPYNSAALLRYRAACDNGLCLCVHPATGDRNVQLYSTAGLVSNIMFTVIKISRTTASRAHLSATNNSFTFALPTVGDHRKMC